MYYCNITKSLYVDKCVLNLINLVQMFPWSLGSNVGFSVSTILIALSTGKEGFVQVALANFFFHGKNY